MALIGILHTYSSGGLLKSSDWNSELDQILAVLGYGGIANPNAQISISGQIDDDSILKLDNKSTGDILQLTNATITSLFKNNGQIVIGANGTLAFIISSAVKCPNLNVDLLDSKNASDLETKLNAFEQFSVFYTAFDASNNLDQEVFVVGEKGILITKLKIQQQEVASADANTTITVSKNGVSIGTISLAGNTNAVVTNDIADIACVEGDIISFSVTTYTGTTKHANITAAIHYKQSYKV